MWICVVMLLIISASCAAAPPTDQLRLRYSDDRSCQPDGVDLIRLSALGDFPPSSQTVAQYDPTMAPMHFDAFPIDTLLIAANTQTDLARFGGSRQLSPTGTMGDLLLLPLELPCKIADDRIATHDGAAVVTLPESGALLIGGVIAGGVQSQVLRLDPGATTASLLAASDGLAAPRTAAAAALAAPPDDTALVVVAGGQDAAAVLAPIELYDVAARRFDATRCPGLAMMQPRSRAGAGALPDGRVLVAGGVSFTNSAFGTAELIDPFRCTVSPDINMPKHLIAPWVGALDDGTVIVAGGELDMLTVRSPNTYIWVFSAEDRALAPYPGDLAFRMLDSATIVPLPGARLAHVGFGHGTNALQVELLYTTGTPYVNSVDFGTAPLLSRVSATALPDGRLLIAGADMSASPVAYIADLNRGTLTPAPANLRATALQTLADGVVLELAPEGASLLRTTNLTAFDSPARLVGSPFLADLVLTDVALDDATHWMVVDVPCPSAASTSVCFALEALPTPAGVSRLDATTLRYADAHITVSVTGDATLLLSAEGVSTKSLSITDTQVSLAGCGAIIDRGPGTTTPRATVTIDRVGETLVLGAGGATKTCAATFGGGRFALGLAAAPGTQLATLEVTRR